MKDAALQHRVRDAVADTGLGVTVQRATTASMDHRDSAVAERPDWEALRERAARLRAATLSRLDEHLARFVAEATRRGVHVHAARDASEARAIVLRIAEEHGAQRILKSKSMTTEEIELNPALEAAGTSPLETDLGEYIVQIADEPPSHITAPALHRSAVDIHQLFRDEGVVPDDAEPSGDLATWLSLEARRHLRARLLDADLGITGANLLVAETGTVVLVENEGNIRYTTTSPPVQIAVAGIDKVIPTLEDLGTILPLLTRSATGQRASAYMSLLSGGYGTLHVILLDGGRVAALADEADRKILACIRCGACLNVCPVYRTVGGHAYGSPYPGPIGALLTPLLRGRPGDHELPFLSSLCGACTDVCPVRVEIHDHLLRLRARAVAAGRCGRAEAAAFRVWAFLAGGERRWRTTVRLARLFAGPAERLGLLRAWTRFRALPRIARRTFHERHDR